MKWVIYIFVAALFSACHNADINPASKIAEHRKPEVSTLFDDINLYTLEGVRPLSARAMFPYISIQDLDSVTKSVAYQRGPGDSTVRIYTKENGYWTTHYHSDEGDADYSTWEYISPEKITELEYKMTDKKDVYLLNAVSLFSKDKSVTYIPDPKKNIRFNPVPTVLDSIQNDLSKMYLETQEHKGDTLTIIDTEVDVKTMKNLRSDTVQWNVGKHSWFWWRQMYTLATKIR